MRNNATKCGSCCFVYRNKSPFQQRKWSEENINSCTLHINSWLNRKGSSVHHYTVYVRHKKECLHVIRRQMWRYLKQMTSGKLLLGSMQFKIYFYQFHSRYPCFLEAKHEYCEFFLYERKRDYFEIVSCSVQCHFTSIFTPTCTPYHVTLKKRKRFSYL
jgi:hypothetical protein